MKKPRLDTEMNDDNSSNTSPPLSSLQQQQRQQQPFPICSWKEWYNQQQKQPQHLLDVRCQEEYNQRHLISNNNDKIIIVHIPMNELSKRRFELPPRHVPLSILISQQQQQSQTTSIIDELQDLLLYGGKTSRKKQNKQQQNNNNNRPVFQWNISAIIYDTPELWEQVKQQKSNINDSIVGIHTTTNNDNSSNSNNYCSYCSCLYPQPRLWKPDCMVRNVLLPIIQKQLLLKLSPRERKNSNIRNNNDDCLLRVYDLGSGVGRDVCYLAEELLSTLQQRNNNNNNNNNEQDQQYYNLFKIIGIDQRYRNIQCNDAIEFWKRRKCYTVTECQCYDLNTDTPNILLKKLLLNNMNSNNDDNNDEDDSSNRQKQQQQQEDNSCSTTPIFMYSIRYWNKKLFQSIVECTTLLPPNSVIAISHFGKPTPYSDWPYTHPKEKNVLERNELRDLFTSSNKTNHGQQRKWNILLDEVVSDREHGRTLIQFVSQLSLE